MNIEQLAYWLRGAVETRNIDSMTEEDMRKLLKEIQNHSTLPFKKVTPELSKDDKDLKDLIKKAAERVEPTGVKVAPFPYFPNRPYDYDRDKYWLGGEGPKPGVLYC